MNLFRALVVLHLCCVGAHAADWPQWLGPQRDGTSSEKVEPWKAPLKAAWRQPVGEGFSVPVIAGGRVFIHAKAKEKEAEELLALDAKTGKELWRSEYPRAKYFSLINNGPQATPTVSLDRVYSYGVTGILCCHEAVTGKRLWMTDVSKKLDATVPRFGVTCSPLVVGDHVLVSVGAKGAGVAAFNADTGELAWKALSGPMTTASPVLFTNRARKGKAAVEAVFVTPTGLTALTPFEGEVSWEFTLTDQPFGTAPSPIRAGDLLLTSSDRGGSVAVQLSFAEGKLTATKGWQNPGLSGYFSSPVVVGSRFYMITTQSLPQPSATLRCVELKTGKELWKRENVGFFHAGLLRTGNNRLLLLDDAGNLSLLADDPKQCQELASAKGICGATFANPALANGCLYLRDRSAVLCVPLEPGKKTD
jgi:outer membrane protein assembly factor BamB